MSKRSAHGTHVWVRTELIEAILHHNGNLPKGWKPSSSRGSRRQSNNGSSSTTVSDWGWARATISGVSSPRSSSNNDSNSNNTPFGGVQLRRTNNTSKQQQQQQEDEEGDSSTPKMVTASIVIDDEEFAPQHLLHSPVSLTYDTKDTSLVCMANAWWRIDAINHNNNGNGAPSISSSSTGRPPDDLTNLAHLHEPAVVFCLQRRYENDAIYTYTGKVLLALNPFRPISSGVYGEDVMQQYWNMGLSATRPPPHVYALAEDAYRSLLRSLERHSADPHGRHKGQDQSILVSGESGAGKTVTTKIVMKYLTTLSQKSDARRQNGAVSGNTNSIEAQVLQSNPILESFGNARTVRNDNSSRFGKFIEIEFNASGSLTSASITTYLLEKVRLITQTPGERNYHIFYEILAGVTQRERQQLRIGNLSAHDFTMTSASGTFDRRDGVGDRETYKTLREALDTVGFTSDEQFDLLTVSCALLHSSNLTFRENEPDTSELDLSNPSLRCAVDLLGVSTIALNEACCRFAIEARGETLYKNLSIPQARKAIEALIKATYQALFSYIAKRINSFITLRDDNSPQERHGNSSAAPPTACIGVLDIFGFESFEENSFEQLCINFCNEALQQQFNKFVFKEEQEIYKKEGIEWSFISFPDNQDVLDLIEKRRDGIIATLDEQCRLQRCTDKTFAMALYDKCADHPRFFASKSQQVNLTFSIQHYAGLVEYSANDFLEKNKDELPKETTELLLNSSYKFVVTLAGLLSESSSEKSNTPAKSNSQQNRNFQRGKSMLRESVGSQFCSQLRDLRSRIGDTSPHYIRCLKPNDDLIPYNFQPLVIADQLRCAGVLEAIRVSRIGFPHRFSHQDFVDLYSVLCRTELDRLSKNAQGKELCEILVQCLVPPIQNFIAHEEGKGQEMIERDSGKNRTHFLGLQMGRSKVFIRPKTFEALELLRGQKVERAAIKIQSAVRMFLSTIRYEISQIATIIIQTAIRRFIAIRQIWRIRLFQRAATIQNSWRLFSAQRKLNGAIAIAQFVQSAHRGGIARDECIILMLERKALIIQRNWKNQRRNQDCGVMSFAKLRSSVVSLQTYQRKRVAVSVLKRFKAEAKDLSCVAKERDNLREETRRLREELEQAKEDAENRATPTKEVEVQQLKTEVKKLRVELEKAKQMPVSPTLSHANELGFLARECEFKELQLKGLRKDLRQQYGLSPAESKDSSFALRHSFTEEKKCMDSSLSNQSHRLQKSPCRSSSTSVSLLDGDMDNSQAFEQMLTVNHDDADSSARTTPTMSISYSTNTSNLQGETFFSELRRLHNAVRGSALDLVDIILRQSSEEPHVLINEGDEIGRTALHVAVLTSNLLMTQTLLGKGAISNSQDNDGETPLHLAEHASMTGVLLKEGRANPNIPNIDGICALHLAVQRRDLDSVRALMLHNADVNSADNVKWFTPLHLIALPARVNEDPRGEEVRVRIAELMSGGATSRYEPDLNYQDSEGNCPIHYAVQLVTPDAYDLIKIFLECGADPKVLNNRSQSALHLICHNNSLRKLPFYPQTLVQVLSRGADPNQQSAAGCTALHLSLYHRDIDSAVKLVANGAQLHPLWKKPKRWVSFWDDRNSSTVLALDMVKHERQLIRILSAISAPQKWAPVRSWCMQCKLTLGTFGRALHCRHCGRFVCGECSPRTLTPDFFPTHFEVDEVAWVCLPCEKILVQRKEFGSSNSSANSSLHDDCSTPFNASFNGYPADLLTEF